MFRILVIAIAMLTSFGAAAGGFPSDEPQVLNRQCFVLGKGETLSVRASADQLKEYKQIAAALGKQATLTVREARLETFRYDGNPGDTALLSFELLNGLKFEAAAHQLDQKTSVYTVDDDGGGYSVVGASGNRIVLLDQSPARIDILVTSEQMKEIEAKTSIMFEGGTGSLTVGEGQSALFTQTPCL